MARTAANTNETNQPLFYKNPVPLTLDKHADAGITKESDYSFTKGTNSSVVTLPEFVEVCKTYPIVFADNNLLDPVAVLGIESSRNLFVSSNGQWEKGVYIPAYVRRYPFAFSQVGQGAEQKLVLCIDDASKKFVKKAKKSDMKFFDGKEQAKITKTALDFCVQFHKDQLATQKFSRAIADAGLFMNKQITATIKGKVKPISLAGFKVVDEKKLRNLDAETLQKWHQNGYLSLIYFHLLSLTNFTPLAKKIK